MSALDHLLYFLLTVDVLKERPLAGVSLANTDQVVLFLAKTCWYL